MTTYPWPSSPPSAADRASFAGAAPRAFWLDDLGALEPRPALAGVTDADLCIVGAGFTGLWAALHAKADDPSRDVVVLEAESAGFGASGRNGGFVVSSLTHGLANGMSRFADELPVLERLGAANLAAPSGRVRSRRVLLATSAFPPLVRAIRRYVVPVYDYVLVSEPLTSEQRDSLGWARRQGIGDSANRFHYYRLTADDRLLWGGFEAVYRFGGPVAPRHDTDEQVFGALAQHLFTTFPQLRGLRFTHRWGGAIDTCSRFSVFFGTAYRGRAAYATGYTGLGVGATRFGARVALDLLDGRETEATRLRYVRSRPVPFPPEPLRWAVVQLTRNRLAAADRAGGRRGLWLRTLDRLGLGFDS